MCISAVISEVGLDELWILTSFLVFWFACSVHCSYYLYIICKLHSLRYISTVFYILTWGSSGLKWYYVLIRQLCSHYGLGGLHWQEISTYLCGSLDLPPWFESSALAGHWLFYSPLLQIRHFCSDVKLWVGLRLMLWHVGYNWVLSLCLPGQILHFLDVFLHRADCLNDISSFPYKSKK